MQQIGQEIPEYTIGVFIVAGGQRVCVSAMLAPLRQHGFFRAKAVMLNSPMQSGIRCVYPLSIFGMPDSIVLFFFCPVFCATLPSALFSSPGPPSPAPDAVRLCPVPPAPSTAPVDGFLIIGLGFVVFATGSTLAFTVKRDEPAGESAIPSFVAFDSARDEPTGRSQYFAYGLDFRDGAVAKDGGAGAGRIFGFVSVDATSGASERTVSSGCTTSTYGRKYWLT